jgi:SAM-dependent methyltransferase
LDLSSKLNGLDDAFMRHIGVRGDVQRYIQEIYLPYFQGRQRVVDLGSGDGDFVALLVERGHEALGVDSDPSIVARAREAGLPVVEADVFDWLEAEAAAVEAGERPSWDGFFSAHLVEHLPYQKVLELCIQAHRLLRPGGVIVLATPNVAAIHAHLDGYYKHFGHVTFYHPDLLSFFLTHSGFEITESGANERVPSTLFFPVLRQLNEHQVELDRIEAVSGELLPRHSDISATSEENHRRFSKMYARFSRLHEQLQAVHGALSAVRASRMVSWEEVAVVPAGSRLRQSLRRLDGVRERVARLLLGPRINQQLAQLHHHQAQVQIKLSLVDLAIEQFQQAVDVAAQTNYQLAQVAELWQQSQMAADQLNDLLARQGTLVRDVARVSRQMEEATRALIGQVDAPFEAFVVARKPEETV